MKSLHDVLAEHLPHEDADTRRLVAAIAGLLAAVADADGDYDPSEARTIRKELRRVHVLTDGGVEAVLSLLHTHLRALVPPPASSFRVSAALAADLARRPPRIGFGLSFVGAANDLHADHPRQPGSNLRAGVLAKEAFRHGVPVVRQPTTTTLGSRARSSASCSGVSPTPARLSSVRCASPLQLGAPASGLPQA